MQIITTEISDKTVAKLNEGKNNANLVADLLHYFGGWEGFKLDDKKYTNATVKKVTNTGIRIDVDGTDIDILWKWKFAWLFSATNQETNATVAPVSDEIIRRIVQYAREAKSVTVPKWKTLSKQYYKNGQGKGDDCCSTYERYNSYTGSKSNFKYT